MDADGSVPGRARVEAVEMDKRWHLFAGLLRSNRGMDDYKGGFDSLEEAIAGYWELEERNGFLFVWAQIAEVTADGLIQRAELGPGGR